MKNKKILEICLAHGLGGLEMFVADCYEDFSKHSSCHVVVEKDSKLDLYLENIEKFYLVRNKLFPIFPALKLAKYIDKYEIDIIHFHWTKDSILVVLAKLLSKRKVQVIQSRHMRMTRFKDDIYHRWIYRNIDMMHAVTQDVEKQLYKFIPQEVRPKMEMIYLGVSVPVHDIKLLEQLKDKYAIEKQFVVGIVGRIEKDKGQYKVIEAIAQLRDFNIKLIIVGNTMEKDYLETLKEKVTELHLNDQVVFTGFTKDVNEHMSLCDAIVLATENETFGLVVIEAMANKKVIIASNKGGPTEIIEDGVDGLFFDGTSSDLAKQIKYLYDNKIKKEEIALNGFKKITQMFAKEQQMEKLYKFMS
jgi:glycosyltransferase involved in cell wall biosynthesis